MAQSEAEYVVFLNNDTTVDAGFVRGLVDAVSGSGAAVCAGAKILDWKGEEFDYAGGWINFAGHGRQRGLGEPYAPGRYDESGPTAYACGGAMIIDREVFLDAGGFDEDYFAIFEDVDLGWRLWLYGHEVVYAPRAVAYHRHHGTLALIGDHRRAARAGRNALATIFKNYDEDNMPRAVAAALLVSTAGVMVTFEQMRTDGKTMILVSHDLDAVARHCDRALLLENGLPQALGQPDEVIDVYRGRERARVG